MLRLAGRHVCDESRQLLARLKDFCVQGICTEMLHLWMYSLCCCMHTIVPLDPRFHVFSTALARTPLWLADIGLHLKSIHISSVYVFAAHGTVSGEESG